VKETDLDEGVVASESHREVTKPFRILDEWRRKCANGRKEQSGHLKSKT